MFLTKHPKTRVPSVNGQEMIKKMNLKLTFNLRQHILKNCKKIVSAFLLNQQSKTIYELNFKNHRTICTSKKCKSVTFCCFWPRCINGPVYHSDVHIRLICTGLFGYLQLNWDFLGSSSLNKPEYIVEKLKLQSSRREQQKFLHI